MPDRISFPSLSFSKQTAQFYPVSIRHPDRKTSHIHFRRNPATQKNCAWHCRLDARKVQETACSDTAAGIFPQWLPFHRRNRRPGSQAASPSHSGLTRNPVAAQDTAPHYRLPIIYRSYNVTLPCTPGISPHRRQWQRVWTIHFPAQPAIGSAPIHS